MDDLTASKELNTKGSSGDVALNLLHSAQEGDVLDIKQSRKLLWKIDLRLIPLLCITYALQSIDKTTLNYAAVFGLRDDLGLSSNEYSWTGAIFYLGYLIWEYPTGLLLQKFPVNHFLSCTVILWGCVLLCHAPVQNFAGLAAVRTFLGVFEASIQPATMLIFSMYYKRQEQPLRMGIWIGSAGLGYVIAGIASFGIGHIRGSLVSWRLMFIFWGSITVAWGFFLLWALPGSPVRAKFLSEDEKTAVLDRIKDNGTGLENKKFKKNQFREAMLDLKTWLLFLFAVASNSPNGGLTTFQGLIIRALGFSVLDTTLIQMPSGGVQAVVCVFACYMASSFSNARLATMLVCLVPFLVGLIGLQTVSYSAPYGRLACLWISFAYTATWTLSMSVATANTAGHTKKVTVNAMLLIGYCLGNFIGPFFFKISQSPQYELGVGMMFFCLAMQVCCIVGIGVLFWRRNKSKQRPATEDEVREAQQNGFLDLTDMENPYFQYVY